MRHKKLILIRDEHRAFPESVIGNAKAVGLCGTALIDAAAELLRHGVIDETGALAAPLAERVDEKYRKENGQPQYVVRNLGTEGGVEARREEARGRSRGRSSPGSPAARRA